MKPENNWQYKTLENLEKDKWPTPDFNSHLVRRCHELRKIPLKNLWAEGDFFEGDLLKNVLNISEDFWKKNKNLWLELYGLIDGKKVELEERKIDAGKFLAKQSIVSLDL
jgi:hypothetical protein